MTVFKKRMDNSLRFISFINVTTFSIVSEHDFKLVYNNHFEVFIFTQNYFSLPGVFWA